MPKTKSAPSAKVIIEDLAKLGLPARLTVAFTGRLIRITYWGARTATCQKQALVISVSQPRTPRGDSKGDVDYGGSVEVFATANEAKARAVYIESVLKADPMLGTEYDYLNGPVLLRVSQYLIPSQAAGIPTSVGEDQGVGGAARHSRLRETGRNSYRA